MDAQVKREMQPSKDDFEGKNAALMADMPSLYAARIDYFLPAVEASLFSKVRCGNIKNRCVSSTWCTVATSPLALRWMCDSPRTGCARRTTHIYKCRKQAITEWSWHVTSTVACCHSVKLCELAARTFRSQQNGAVTRMWRSCSVKPSQNERAIGAVRCKREGMLLQPLCWCCVECAIHRNGMCAKNNTHQWRKQAITEWSWHVISVVAFVKLCALTARAFRSQQYLTCLHNSVSCYTLCANIK